MRTKRFTLDMGEHTRNSPAPTRHEVTEMFNRIARRYDFLNRLLSFGMDVSWRKKMAQFLPLDDDQHLLDLATGTADQILFLFDSSDKVKSGVGMDLAEKMLETGREKIRKRRLSEVVSLQIGDAMDIPADDSQFDAVTISFGIRNVTDVEKALSEIYRVLKPGGRLLVLEFSLPQNQLLRRAYLVYLRHILPRMGALVSGDPHAYQYLSETIEIFPYGGGFCDLLWASAFIAVQAHPVTFGVATIYKGDRPVHSRRGRHAT
jgi:demethylmenaquinone methyltransferase/2-methoxy-6-polyprenyl-1,4-benzoquinol methylase